MSEQQFVLILFQVVVLVLAFSVHESAHAYMAMRLGDPTAYMLGRVTTRNFRHIRRDDILVSLAGPASNLAMATTALLLLIVFKHTGGVAAINAAMLMANRVPGVDTGGMPLFPMAMLLYYGVTVNLLLFVFNLIPVPPLDGSHVLRQFLSYRVEQVYDRIGMYGLVVIFLFGGRWIFGTFYYPLLNVFDGLLRSL
jgi:Zn-dependent protease